MTSEASSGKCDRCKREGLAFFPVLYAAAPKQTSGLPEVSGRFGKGVVDKRLQESTYFLKSLPAGYLYLLFPNNVWRGYFVDSQGAMKYYPNLTLEDMPERVSDKPYSETCARAGHSTPAIQSFVIEGSSCYKPPIWVGFSRHRWSAESRKKIESRPAERMQPITSLDGSAFDHAEIASADNLTKYVANFNATAVGSIKTQLSEEFHLHDLSDQAPAISRSMLGHSGQLQAQGLILALPDPVGIAAALNNTRNAFWEDQAELEKKHEMETFALSAIRSLEGQAKASENFAKVWEEKYKDLVVWDKIPGFETLIKRERERISLSIERSASDWLKWERSPELQTVMECDFLGSIDEALLFPCAVVWFTAGAGGAIIEREKWLPEVIDPDNERNYLWRASFLDRPDLGSFLKDDGNLITEYNGAKWLYSMIDQWLAEQERLVGLNRAMQAAFLSPYARKTLQEVASSLHVALQSLEAAAKANGKRFLASMALSAYLHGVEVMPMPVRESVRNIVGMQREVLWKPVAALFEIEQKSATQIKWKVDISKLTAAADIHVSAHMSATVFVVTRVRFGTVWQATELFKPYHATMVDGDYVPTPPPQPYPTKPPGRIAKAGQAIGQTVGSAGKAVKQGAGKVSYATRNWWLANREAVTKLLSNPQLAGSLSAFAAGFQAVSFRHAMENLDGAMTPTERQQAQLALYSTGIAATGFSIEVLAAGLQLAKSAAAKAAGEEAMKVLLRRVGKIGAVGEAVGAMAGLIATVQSVFSAASLFKAGDVDASILVGWQTAALALSSLASGSAAWTLYGTAASGGATVTFLGLGPAGWFLVAVVGTVALIGLLYLTAMAADDPLESWLKQCAFGAYRNEEWHADIQKAKYEKVFEIPLTLDLEWKVKKPVLEEVDLHASTFEEELTLVITVPALGEDSCVATELEFSGDEGRMVVNCVMTPRGGQYDVDPPHLLPRNQWADGAHFWSKNDNGLMRLRVRHQQKSVNPAKDEVFKSKSDKVIPNPDRLRPVYTRVSVITRHWPHQVDDPNLVLPSDHGRLDHLVSEAPGFVAKALEAKAKAQERATACFDSGRCSGDEIRW